MILDADLDDVEWLLSERARVLIDEIACEKGNGLAAATALRKTLPAGRARLVIEQAQLRHKAREKFSNAQRMFFTPLGLQQATDEAIAHYKARRFGVGGSVVDLCCGIGGDLVGLSARGPAAGVERHAIVARLAEANGHASVRAVDVESIDPSEFDAWHIDPDRRAHGGRTTHIEHYEPGPTAIDRLLQASPNGAVKLAPASDVPSAWASSAQREWITCRRECRQQVLWFGDLSLAPATHRATVIVADQPPATLAGEADLPFDAAGNLRRFVFVPDSAVIAAHLVGELATQFDLASIDGRTAWLTGDRHISNALWSTFEVLESHPFDRRRLRASLRARRVGHLEIKTRSINVNIEQLRRELASPGDDEATLLVTPLFERTTAIIARRISAATSRAIR
jgi:hypothetical protein